MNKSMCREVFHCKTCTFSNRRKLLAGQNDGKGHTLSEKIRNAGPVHCAAEGGYAFEMEYQTQHPVWLCLMGHETVSKAGNQSRGGGGGGVLAQHRLTHDRLDSKPLLSPLGASNLSWISSSLHPNLNTSTYCGTQLLETR